MYPTVTRAARIMNDETHATDEDARALRALAHLVSRIRPDWDPPGVAAKLSEAHTAGRPIGPLSIAALRAAQDQSNRTPAVIPLDGAHWREQTATKTEPRPAYDRPKINGQPASVAELPTPGDYQRGAAAARAHIRAAIDHATAHGFKYKGDPADAPF